MARLARGRLGGVVALGGGAAAGVKAGHLAPHDSAFARGRTLLGERASGCRNGGENVNTTRSFPFVLWDFFF